MVVEDDCEDQACMPTKVCTKCRIGFRQLGKPVFASLYPKCATPNLITYCCSNCGASYGENPHPDLPKLDKLPGE